MGVQKHTPPQSLRRSLVLALLAVMLLGLSSCSVLDQNVTNADAAAEIRSEPFALPDTTLGMRTNEGFFDLQEFRRTEQWLGRRIKYTVQFTGKTSPKEMNGAAFGLLASDSAELADVADRVTLVLAVPLAFVENNEGDANAGTSGREGLLATASGEYDDAFRRVTRRLIEAGHGGAIIRLGHEFNGQWAPWSAVGNEDAFIAAWRHVHEIFRSESPDFRFDWTAMRADWANTAPQAWPGDDYVDYVGMDIYWKADGGDGWSENRWNSEFLPNLLAHHRFAEAHGKPVSYPEWGIEGVDVPEYIEAMHGWFADLPDDGPGALSYQAYFDGGRGFALTNYSRSEARFEELFGSSA